MKRTVGSNPAPGLELENTMISFCSITTLLPKYRQRILSEMSWTNGGMSYLLKHNAPRCKLALRFEGKQLVCWAIMCFLDYEKNGRPFVGAWTSEKNRRKNHAHDTIAALLDHLRFPTVSKISVYGMSIHRILKRIGYVATYQQWDEDKLRRWLNKNCARKVKKCQ